MNRTIRIRRARGAAQPSRCALVAGHARSARSTSRTSALAAATAAALVAALIGGAPTTARADVTTPHPILFVTQVPVGVFATVTAVFGNHVASVGSAPRGGDLVLRYPDGTLRFLTEEAGYGNAGQQGANAIAVREPSVHWSGEKALFSMVVGAATQQYQVNSYRWQIYEVTGLGVGQTAEIRKVSGQPEGFNNVSPIYGTDDRILFASDRPNTGELHHYPMRDEYESTPIVTGIYRLDEAAGTFELIEHSPSGSTSLSLDSFGRVIFTKWDHLQRDQQGDAPATAASFKAFTWASEAADAPKTTSLIGAEVFPEPRNTNDPAYSPALETHRFNHFLPWEINEDGTGEETLNHVGRHELGGAFTEGSFTADPNLTYYVSPSLHANTFKISGSAGLFHLREDPTSPGDFLTTYAPEFSTASGGVILRLTGAPNVNPESMTLTPVTPATGGPLVNGYFRNPLPLSDGSIVASHTTTSGTGYLVNLGNTAAPNWSYDYRLKLLEQNGDTMTAGEGLTGGIVKNITWWTPDVGASYNGPLWELDAVEVVARAVPAARQSVLPDIEAGVFAAKGVDVDEFRDFLRDNDLALIVGRDVTQRDRADRQQPFNLKVPGGTQSIASGGTAYDVAHLQVFQADAVRGYGDLASPQPGRRLLARPMHASGVSQSAGAPTGAVTLAIDGSFAALVPAKRALTWQLTDPAGEGVVRERNWISFQSGEIRVCASCHGINTQSQTGEADPENEPLALHQFLEAWLTGGDGGGGDGDGGEPCASGLALDKPRLKASAAPFAMKLSGAATLPTPFVAVDPAVSGVRLVVGGVLDATIGGGEGWKTTRSGWVYRNKLGAVAGVRRIVVKDLSKKADGKLSVRVHAGGTPVTLPAPDAVEASVWFGGPGECASAAWNGPEGGKPRCRGNAGKVACG